MMYFSSIFILLLSIWISTVDSDPWSRQSIEVFCKAEDYNVKVRRQGCETQNFNVKACLGNCRSFDQPLQDVPFFTSRCQLCKADVVTKKKFSLDRCNDNMDKSVFIESAVTCSCITSECY